MTTDIVTLGWKVNVTDIVAADKKLNQLILTGEKVDIVIKKMNKSFLLLGDKSAIITKLTGAMQRFNTTLGKTDLTTLGLNKSIKAVGASSTGVNLATERVGLLNAALVRSTASAAGLGTALVNAGAEGGALSVPAVAMAEGAAIGATAGHGGGKSHFMAKRGVRQAHGAGMTGMSGGMVGRMVAAVVAFTAITAGAKALLTFEQSMGAVQAVTKATATEMVALTKIARHLGETTEFTASQVAEGLKFLGMAGLTAQQSIAALPAVVDLATAGLIDLGQAADISSNIMTSFDIKAKNMVKVTDTIAAISAAANTNVLQLASAMENAAPFANRLGISIGDTAASLGVLANTSLQGSIGGTKLARAFTNLVNLTPVAERAIKRYGLTLKEVNPTLNKWPDIVRKFAAAGLTLQDSLKIFGIRGGLAMTVLLGKMPMFERLLKEMKDVNAEAKRMADIMRDRLSGDLKFLASAAESVVLSLGESGLTKSLRSTLQMFTSFFRVIAANGDTAWAIISGLTAALIAYALAANGAAIATGLFTASIKFFTGPVGLLATVIGLVIMAITRQKLSLNEAKKATVDYVKIAKTLDAINGRISSSSDGLTSSLNKEATASLTAANAALEHARASLISEQAYLSGQRANQQMRSIIAKGLGPDSITNLPLMVSNKNVTESEANLKQIDAMITSIGNKRLALIYGMRVPGGVKKVPIKPPKLIPPVASDALKQYTDGMAALAIQMQSIDLSPFNQSIVQAASGMGFTNKEITDFIATLKDGGIDAASEKFQALAGAMGKLAAANDNQALIKSNQTVFESYGIELQKLDVLLAEKAIGWDTYWRAASGATAQAAAKIFGSLATLSAGLSQAFEKNKALSVATAVLKGAEAVAGAFAAGNNIGGPVVGAIYAAIAAVTAVANVAAVANVNQSSTSMSGGGGGGGSPSVPTQSVPNSAPTFNIELHGSGYSPQNIEDLIDELNNAIGDGATINVSRAA